jgi:hypothetical protein
MKQTGIIVLIIGLVITVFTGFNFMTREKVVDLGELEITQNKKHGISWSPIIGIVVMVVGGGMVLFGTVKK